MSNIFDTLVNNNAFLSHDKFQSHEKHAIGFFVNICPRIKLRDILCEKIQDALMWIDIDDEIIKPMIREIRDKEGLTTGKQRIIIQVFDLYSKEVGIGSETNKIKTFAYEIRTYLENPMMLKNLLCKISKENVNDIKFTPYGLDSMTKTIQRDKLSSNKIHS